MPLSYLCADGNKQVVTHIWEWCQFESMYTLEEAVTSGVLMKEDDAGGTPIAWLH
jgi:hypothetical protein